MGIAHPSRRRASRGSLRRALSCSTFLLPRLKSIFLSRVASFRDAVFHGWAYLLGRSRPPVSLSASVVLVNVRSGISPRCRAPTSFPQMSKAQRTSHIPSNARRLRLERTVQGKPCQSLRWQWHLIARQLIANARIQDARRNAADPNRMLSTAPLVSCVSRGPKFWWISCQRVIFSPSSSTRQGNTESDISRSSIFGRGDLNSAPVSPLSVEPARH